jgi:hypothetical protein
LKTTLFTFVAKNFRGKKIFVAKKFREIFFENNTIHLRGKKFSWQKNFRGKKFREIFFENNTIHLHGKIFVAKKISWQKISWQKNFCGKKILRNIF